MDKCDYSFIQFILRATEYMYIIPVYVGLCLLVYIFAEVPENGNRQNCENNKMVEN